MPTGIYERKRQAEQYSITSSGLERTEDMTKRQEPDGFETYWSIWRPNARHTDGRGLARETFAKLVKNGADPQDIIDGAKWFFSTMKDRDRDYVPLSSTWLNRQSFEDLAEQYRAHEARKAERLRVVEGQRAQEQSTNVVSIDAERRAELAARARAVVGGVKLQEA